MIMGTIPFQFLGDVDVLVAQMIHFVEDLPEEWKPEWERMKKRSGRNFDDIPGELTSYLVDIPSDYLTSCFRYHACQIKTPRKIRRAGPWARVRSVPPCHPGVDAVPSV